MSRFSYCFAKLFILGAVYGNGDLSTLPAIYLVCLRSDKPEPSWGATSGM